MWRLVVLVLMVAALAVKAWTASTIVKLGSSAASFWTHSRLHKLGNHRLNDRTMFALHATGSEFERDDMTTSKQIAKITSEETSDNTTSQSKKKNDDDEPEISTEMKKRLLRELRSQGGDASYSAGPVLGNPILLISLIVAVLVIAGGKGFFY